MKRQTLRKQLQVRKNPNMLTGWQSRQVMVMVTAGSNIQRTTFHLYPMSSSAWNADIQLTWHAWDVLRCYAITLCAL